MRIVCWIVDGTCRIDKNCLLETSIDTVSVFESNLDLQNSACGFSCDTECSNVQGMNLRMTEE